MAEALQQTKRSSRCEDGTLELDNDGFLFQMEHWSRAAAIELAKRNDIGPLSDEHWQVIEFVHAYYEQHRQGPPIVRVGKAPGLSAKRICELFPCGMARGAYRLAGLPRPSGCV